MVLALKHHALELFKQRKLLVDAVAFGISPFPRLQKSNLFQFLQFPLDVAGILFDEFGHTPDVGLKIRVLGKQNDDFAAGFGSDKHIQHKSFAPNSIIYVSGCFWWC
jgi:hypothetical protein